ncbi:hypothetical protein DCC79_06770 [bacterium]|nr:MAG: hypothetical protein DCC79_06770 [bacterium]
MRRGVHLLALLGLSGCASLPPLDVPSAARPQPQPAAPTAVAVALPAMEALDATEARPLPLGHDLVITTADGGRATVGIHEVRAGRRAMATLAELDPGHRPPAAGMRFYLVRVRIALEVTRDPAFARIDPSLFSLHAGGRRFAAAPAGVAVPQPALRGELTAPGRLEGWLAFEAPPAADARLVFHRGSGSAATASWFHVRDPAQPQRACSDADQTL